MERDRPSLATLRSQGKIGGLHRAEPEAGTEVVRWVSACNGDADSGSALWQSFEGVQVPVTAAEAEVSDDSLAYSAGPI